MLGKGKHIQNFTGNVRFRQLLDIHLPRYEASSKYEKADVVDFIIRAISESTGRFLKEDCNGYWEEATDADYVHTKVAGSFRARRAARKRAQQQQ